MKKFLLIFCFIFISCQFALADYKPVPKNLSLQYKKEISQTINNKYPILIENIFKIEKEANSMYKQVIKNKELYFNFCNRQFDMAIDTPLFYLYLELTKITQKYAYLNDEDIPSTDFSGTLHNFLLPYLTDNNIKINKLKKLNSLTNNKLQKINYYYKKANEFFYSEKN